MRLLFHLPASILSMSPTKKLSLWQRIKRRLTATVPSAAVTVSVVKREDNTASLTDSSSDSSAASIVNIKSATTNKAANAQINNPQNSHPQSSQTPIVDCLKQYLHAKHWQYTYYRPKSFDSQQSHHLSMRIKNKQANCGYLFRVQEGNHLLAVYGILPFLIPESHQSAAMLLITQINYDMLIGNLEMDIDDGEIRYKNTIDLESTAINERVIEQLLQSVIAMTTAAYEIFTDLIDTEDPAEDMPTLLHEIRQQADARKFFLPTQKMQ